MSHAATDPGVNVNQLLDGSLLDPLSGNAVLNGVPVEITARLPVCRARTGLRRSGDL
jgi:hypothetical protein